MARSHDRQGPPGDPPDGEEAAEPDDPEAIDLHGLRPEDALRRLAQGIHACRVRRVDRLRIITGRGWGNLRQQPILRPRVEQWLAGPDGRLAAAYDAGDGVHPNDAGHAIIFQRVDAVLQSGRCVAAPH